MMISPEGYYEEFLKGKTVPQLMTAIRGLKQEIGHLKSVMEQWEYSSAPLVQPNEATRLWCTRQYLDRAKQAFSDAGGSYETSRAEKKAADFDDNIPAITIVIFCIGGYFGGYETTTISLDDDHTRIDVEHMLIPKPSNFWIPQDDRFTKEELLDGIRELHIGEWRTTYNNPDILDGTQWDLEFQYGNGRKPVKMGGSNAYPYNFLDFTNLLGINAGGYGF